MDIQTYNKIIHNEHFMYYFNRLQDAFSIALEHNEQSIQFKILESDDKIDDVYISAVLQVLLQELGYKCRLVPAVEYSLAVDQTLLRTSYIVIQAFW